MSSKKCVLNGGSVENGQNAFEYSQAMISCDLGVSKAGLDEFLHRATFREGWR